MSMGGMGKSKRHTCEDQMMTIMRWILHLLSIVGEKHGVSDTQIEPKVCQNL